MLAMRFQPGNMIFAIRLSGGLTVQLFQPSKWSNYERKYHESPENDVATKRIPIRLRKNATKRLYF